MVREHFLRARKMRATAAAAMPTPTAILTSRLRSQLGRGAAPVMCSGLAPIPTALAIRVLNSWNPNHGFQLPGSRRWAGIGENPLKKPVRVRLYTLSHARWELSTPLHRGQNVWRRTPFEQWVCQQIRGSNRILNREIDTHPAGG